MKIKRWGLRHLLLICIIYFILFSTVQLHAVRTAAFAEQIPTVVIDAGHGGEDGGASTATGVSESALNLEIASKLEKLLVLCGVRIKMIRTEDASVATEGNTIRERKRSDLKRRIDIVEQTDMPIYVSIHQNHFDRSEYRGLQVFYREDGRSKELAEALQDLFKNAVNSANRRRPQRAESVYIMQKISCPAILVECGFLSNPQEAMLLQDDGYQRSLSCVIGSALTQFIEEGEIDIEV